MRRVWALFLVLAAPWLVHGCGEDEASGASAPDAGGDVAKEVAADVVTEAEAGVDASQDADALTEVQSDGDASDAGAADASSDATSDADGGEADAGTKLGVMSLAELAALLPTKSFLLLNVHVPYAGEIPKTDKNLSYQDVAGIESFIGPNKTAEVVLYCYSNTMAILAGNALVADGYVNVRYMDGGLSAWKNAGYAVEFHDY